MTEKKKVKIILAGNLTWDKVRDNFIEMMKKCRNEKEFLKVIKTIYFSCSSSGEEMQRKRRLLGIPET